jgi:hypothetical protein
MKKSTLALLLLAFTAVFLIQLPARVFAGPAEDVQVARAIGTLLDPKGKSKAAIAKGENYFGEADILGKPFVTGYESIRDASSNVIGVYYVG